MWPESILGGPEAGGNAAIAAAANAGNGAVLATHPPFNATGNGVTNDTVALKAFFDYCISNNVRGHIPAGSYLVTAGQLVFDNGWTDKAWPEITTAGAKLVTFLRADNTDAPLLEISNGTASVVTARYWRFGSLGGITFSQNGKTTASGQHGLSLRGMWGTKFGYMVGNSLGGSTVHFPEKLYGGTDPDAYAVTFCYFDGVEGNSNKRYSVENRNWVGLNFCEFKVVRAVLCELGMFYGFGSGNIVYMASAGSCAGWALDDGTATAATGGPPNKFTLFMAELDDVQNGFRLNRSTLVSAKFVRFIHRYNFTALNSSEGYWPRKAISIGGGTSPNTSQIEINCIHRLEFGGVKADLGTFIDMHSAGGNINGFVCDQKVIDSPSFGFLDSELYANYNINSIVKLTRELKPILEGLVRPLVIVRSSTSDTLPSSGWPTATGKITFSTVDSDKGGYYSASDSWFVVPYTGLYRVDAQVCLSTTAGYRVRLAFCADTGGSVAAVLCQISFAVNTGVAQHYRIGGLLSLTAGQKIFLSGDNNSGSAINFSTPIAASVDLVMSFQAV